MNYLLCPDDGEHLKAAMGRPPDERPLVVGCPSCGKRFTFGPDGLRELPTEPMRDG